MKELLEKFFEERGFFVGFENPTEPDEEVKEDEKVLGEMNDLEKGLYTFIEIKRKEHVDIKKKVTLLLLGQLKREEVSEIESEHAKNHQVTEIAKNIMWASIEGRLQTSKETTGIGVRKGFKIVEGYKDEEPSGHGIIIPGIGAIISMQM